MASRKKKIEDENIKFMSEWTEHFAFVRNSRGHPLCFIYSEELANDEKKKKIQSWEAFSEETQWLCWKLSSWRCQKESCGGTAAQSKAELECIHKMGEVLQRYNNCHFCDKSWDSKTWKTFYRWWIYKRLFHQCICSEN